MNTFLRDQLKDFANSIDKIMPRRIALASGILLFISLFATSRSRAALAFGGGIVTPSSQVVCSGNAGMLTFTAASVTAGTVDWTAHYHWQSSPDNLTWTNIVGATGTLSATSPIATYVTPVLTFAGPGCGAPTYYRIILDTIVNSLAGDPFTSPSGSGVTITVCANPAAITGPNVVCQGSTITVADATAGPATWSSSTYHRGFDL